MTTFLLAAVVFIGVCFILKWKDGVDQKLREATQQLNNIKEAQNARKLDTSTDDSRH